MTPEERKALKEKFLTEFKATLAEEYKASNVLVSFETWSDLYYARFRHLGPGKSESFEFGGFQQLPKITPNISF